MAKKKKTTTTTSRKKISFSLSKQQKILLGSFLFLLGLALLFSFISYFFTWQADQSEIGILAERELQTKNWLNKFGANVAHFFIYDGFGISAFIFAFLVTLTGVYYFFDYAKKQLTKFWFWGLLLMLWISVFFGFFGEKTTIFSGIIGYETNDLMQDYLGLVGALLVMVFVLIVYLVVRLKLTPEMAIGAFKSSKKQIASEFVSEEKDTLSEIETEDEEDFSEPYIEEKVTSPPPEKIILKSDLEGDVAMEVEQAPEEEEIENISERLVKDFGEFDPKLELSNYKFPSIELLRDHTAGGGITIDQEELEENKNRIVETLNNYKIGIANIKATVGPTVTLYEIVPDAGIRISKIKNLEDDIALSLSALGIRIIAPIPGRGTIGIEVPNKNPKVVSMRSVIASAKFQNAEMELPIAFGKTISNETFVVDLAKMPHMLMAGATGQGKSVGLNAVLTSLLYKKHPAEVKFVLVDPKKVELTLFNKIERHYLAKLPDTEEAIITDTAKVINTLNSLCIEMDARYDLLKDAMVRNIKEYNVKFKNRKLNPNEGHRFLPYIVLVIDEFADLIMTAGKEVETPIARLAQLARAIGIHLIVATQRPSVNVITGIIKANFPARIAFRVTSKIDSRTILDNSGADQLIGRG
ncbi:MAG: DNA translocase FtsK 4TM domain-containing protein, partial [Aequorivita sp.]|nr:DNA translocase FtsK 4TM domain-containing protein [Aequorivita sp.]